MRFADLVAIEFGLTDAGWAEVRIATTDHPQDAWLQFPASYVSNCFTDFARAVLDVADERGRSEASVVWYAEPAETRLKLVRAKDDVVLEFSSRTADRGPWRVLGSLRAGRRDLINIAINALSGIDRDEYASQWSDPYPERELGELRRLLG